VASRVESNKTFSSETPVDFQLKIELFITTGVKTSNPTLGLTGAEALQYLKAEGQKS
jgi:hypothetical protein